MSTAPETEPATEAAETDPPETSAVETEDPGTKGFLPVTRSGPDGVNASAAPQEGPERITYGMSGSGRYPLTAYRFGTGRNVLVLTFAMHGFEDAWPRDGAELVYLGLAVKNRLAECSELICDGDWTVYVLPCLNPDGLYLGTSPSGPGRCTVTYYNANGETVRDGKRGVDMNRCFPYCFVRADSSRNYNTGKPLACPEAEALAEWIPTLMGSGKNYLIDVHGWYSQILPSSGKGFLYQTLLAQFPRSSYSGLRGCPGYFSSWAAFRLGYDCCLLELPGSVRSHEDLLEQQIPERMIAAVEAILQSTVPERPVQSPLR